MISTNPSGSMGLERMCVGGWERVCVRCRESVCVFAASMKATVWPNTWVSQNSTVYEHVWWKQSCIMKRPKDIFIAVRLLFIAQELYWISQLCFYRRCLF